MPTDDRLRDYRDRRDFQQSPEPPGQDADADRRGDEPVFVVQEHAASTHHFDLRLEIDGVLKSWAVPKGPSTDPREKRLAVATEDHPLDYADFEGVIPEDEYGGGTVLVWDAGRFRNLKRDDDGDAVPLSRALDAGHLVVSLGGRKLQGGYSLKRFRGDDQWLLVKMDDEAADARRNPVSTQPRSVLTGRDLDEVRAEEAGGES
jgi:DNA ligase D-like protein (predicted 3'-phosphoesterase)